MDQKIKCPVCQQTTNQIIDNTFNTFTFQCLQMGCHHVFKMELGISSPKVPEHLMIVVKTEIPRQIIENVFVTALEGGSNYWYFLPEKSVKAIRDAVPKSVEPYLSAAITKAILDHGVEVAIHDAEDEDEEVGVISLKTMTERLQKLATDCKNIFDIEMREEGDADSSDVWIQYMAMGEVVYS